MKPFADFKAEYTEQKKSKPLPAGAYVGKVLGAKLENGNFGEKIVMQLDVTEGEYTNFFRKAWDDSANSSYGQKWKGTYRLSVPKDDGSEQDAGRKRGFSSAMGAFEKSNPGYKWDWNEQSLKGKAIGFTVRDREYDVNGYQGMTTEIAFLCPVNLVRDGKVDTPKAKMLDGSNKPKNGSNDVPAGFVDVTENDELPF